MDLSTVAAGVAAVQQGTLARTSTAIRDELDTLADSSLNPLRNWLTDFDIALTDAEDAAAALADADPCGCIQRRKALVEALDVLHCELANLAADVASAAAIGQIPEQCTPARAGI